MTIKELATIIKIMSFYKIDRRKGNYTLLNGEKLSTYLEELTNRFLLNNGFVIASDNQVYDCIEKIEDLKDGSKIRRRYAFKPFGNDEEIDLNIQDSQIKKMVRTYLI